MSPLFYTAGISAPVLTSGGDGKMDIYHSSTSNCSIFSTNSYAIGLSASKSSRTCQTHTNTILSFSTL